MLYTILDAEKLNSKIGEEALDFIRRNYSLKINDLIRQCLEKKGLGDKYVYVVGQLESIAQPQPVRGYSFR